MKVQILDFVSKATTFLQFLFLNNSQLYFFFLKSTT